MPDTQIPILSDIVRTPSAREAALRKSKKWWFMVCVNIIFLLAGQTAAMLLGRFYFDKGGQSMWISTFVQTAAFPVLLLAFIAIPSSTTTSSTDVVPHASIASLAFVYISIGLIIVADNLMYSYGLLYLPISTYSLVCATQLAFNSIFSYFINKQKFTILIFNSVVVLTFSAALLGVDPDSNTSSVIPSGKRPLGFILTIGASAVYSLILSLIQLSFEKVIMKIEYSAVIEMQFYTSAIATIASVIGLFGSGEWKSLPGEMRGFESGKFSYVMTLVGTAVSWQVASVGVIGLIFEVSSLFSNVISTLALPIVPVFAVIFFHDGFNGIKVIALLLAVWGFVSYIYQNHLDVKKLKKASASARDENGVEVLTEMGGNSGGDHMIK
ncbi:putative purine permease 11 [Zostera marina]|uniref:Probable purine permease n=1 Tax=Zostera marina TaxID=29655 RepID=A0A0K9P284_ZOSMR|nr:putative purine permease 11 [Zostera marina]